MRSKRRESFLSAHAHIIAQEIVDDFEAALAQFRLIATDLGKETL